MENLWLIDESALAELKELYSGLTLSDRRELLEQSGSQGDLSEIMSVVGGVATIRVSGILSPEPNVFMRFFGIPNTAYAEVIAAVDRCENDQSIKDVVFHYDSPGGNAKGFFGAVDKIKSLSKPKRALVDSASSAAYGMACVSGQIFATEKASSVGSVGVVTTYALSEGLVDITNTESPNKRPDVTTKKGKSVVVSLLDELYDLFSEEVALGRSIKKSEVGSKFGSGATFLAAEALSRGMIDGINESQTGPQLKNATANPGGVSATKQEIQKMDLKELETQHPNLFSEAVQLGVKKERERVQCHAMRGKSSGAIALAMQAIEDGDEYTALFGAKYDAANDKKLASRDFSQDDDEAESALSGADKSSSMSSEEQEFIRAFNSASGSVGVFK